MKKLISPVIVGALAFGLLMFVDRCCHSDAALKAAKAEYAALKQASERYKAEQEQVLLHAEETITQQNAAIAHAEAEAAAKQARINTLGAELAALQAAEPAQPELEGQPLVISLRKQVTWLTDMLSLAQGVAADKDKELAAWQVKYYAQVDISASWKRQYENEYALRVHAEALFKAAEHGRRVNALWRTVAIGGTLAGMVAGYALH